MGNDHQPLVFISYRRIDSAAASRLLSENLRAIFGLGSVFIDTNDIRIGTDWPARINERLQAASVLLVVIGPAWLRAEDKFGRRRLDKSDDWVSNEIAYAIDNKLVIIPFCIAGASLPEKEALPERIVKLADQQDIKVYYESWDNDLNRLITLLEELGFQRAGSAAPVRLPRPKVNPDPLTESEIENALRHLPGWKIITSSIPGKEPNKRTELMRTYEFARFEDAIAFMTEATNYISLVQHHPRWENTWRTLRVWLSSWDIRMPTFAGAAVEGVPFIGPLLGEGVKATAEHLLDRRNNLQRNRVAELLEDPVNELTRVFVDELNQLVESHVLFGSQRAKKHRVLLFFDTFEQLAAEAAPWLLNYFLPTEINASIVLIIAGRDPIERSISDDTKRWLSHIDNEIIYWIPLNSFTEDETRTYLINRNITDPERIVTIWQLSQGLPLYLSLLTSNPGGKVDPTADVVANFLRWIPEREQIKRQLSLDAALFSRPFTQDDLAAFTYLPEKELPSLYHWLVGQPFVHPQDGRYDYHDLAQELFSRHLYQRSKKEYYATRRGIANYYQRLLEEIQGEKGLEAYQLMEWLELILAQIDQLFTLPDEASHFKAVELILNTFQYTDAEQNGEIVKFLNVLSQKQTSFQISTGAQQTTKDLLQYIEADARSQDRLTSATMLLKRVELSQSFSPDVRAQIYCDRGWAYLRLKDYEQAVSDFHSALVLKPEYARAYGRRGLAYRFLKDYQRALVDFDRAIELNPQDTWTYERRGRIYRDLGNYWRAIEDFDHAVELDSHYVWAYFHRGITYRLLKDYEQALAEFDRALELRPHYASILAERGLTSLWMQNIEQAVIDYTHSRELDFYYLQNHNNWMAIWSGMCYEISDVEVIERLEIIATTDPENPVAFVCRGVVKWLLRNFEEALQELEQANQIAPNEWDAYFWKGMAYASLTQDAVAMGAIEKASELGLPPILLTPLRWFEHDRRDFYQKYVVPLMAHNELL